MATQRAYLSLLAVLAVGLGLPRAGSTEQSQATPSGTIPRGLHIVLGLEARKPSPQPRGSESAGRTRPAISDNELAEAERVIRARITGYGLPEPTLQTEKTDTPSWAARLLIDIPGGEQSEQTYAGLAALLTTPGWFEIRAIPRTYAYGDNRPVETLEAGDVVFRFTGPDGKAVPTSTVIANSRRLVTSRDFEPDAQVVSGPGRPNAVSFRLEPGPASAFRSFTGAHIGSYLAMVLDDRLLSCPIVRDAIAGEGMIVVDGDQPGGGEQAKQLAVMINSGPLPVKTRYRAVAGNAQATLRALAPLKGEGREQPNAYERAVLEAVTTALSANQLDMAVELLASLKPYPLCREATEAFLGVARALRQTGRSGEAADLLQRNLAADPFSGEAPESLELLAEILESDLGRAGGAKAARVRLAVDYFPSIPSVARAIAALGAEIPKIPGGKMILLDSTLMESSIYDRGSTGSCGFGQYEVIRTLAEAGYVVHETSHCESLTPEILARYRLVVLNGRYGGVADPPIPPEVLRGLVDYVKNGGSLLVVAGGKALGSGQEAQFYNGLLSHFGLRFAEGAALPDRWIAGRATAHPAMRGVTRFHWEHGVPVMAGRGQVLGRAGKDAVIAAAEYGRGRVVATGLGSGFMGQCLNSSFEERKDIAAANTVLLVKLAAYLTGPVR